MRLSRPGRPRHGHALKETHTVSLDPQVVANLCALGKGNLSAGIALAEFCARGSPVRELRPPRPPNPFEDPKGWITFELVDGPADPPAPGEVLDPFREALPR